MSTWTAIPTSVLEVGQPIRSIDIIALRDNILAVPAGAAGAPRVQGDALANPLTMPGNLRIENAAPQTIWRETDQALPAGLWRVALDNNRWDIRRNTALAGDFSTENSPFWIGPDETVTANGNNLNLFNTRSHTGNGWQRLPGGLLIQWGSVAVVIPNEATITFPVAFTSVLSFSAFFDYLFSARGYHDRYGNLTNTQFQLGWDSTSSHGIGNTGTVRYIAVGV